MQEEKATHKITPSINSRSTIQEESQLQQPLALIQPDKNNTIKKK